MKCVLKAIGITFSVFIGTIALVCILPLWIYGYIHDRDE